MYKLTKQTVYLPVKVEYGLKTELIQEEGYFFTPEQLNEYTANVIKQALESAAEKAYIDNNHTQGCAMESDDFEVNKESITNTFEETFKQVEV